MLTRFTTLRYDRLRDGALERSIPHALQCLFVRLQHSTSSAVGTEELTTAFGWDSGETFAQHDICELMRVLFSALIKVCVCVFMCVC